MTRITTIEAVIRALGGRVTAARKAGVVPTAVSNWKRAGRIAPENYVWMIDDLRDAGMTAPAALWGMKARSRKATKKPGITAGL